MTGTDKSPSEISDFKEGHTDTTVSFTVISTKEKIDAFEKAKGGLIGKFKLSTTISTNNMTLFDEEGKIHKYKTALDILRYFFHHRLEFYAKRKVSSFTSCFTSLHIRQSTNHFSLLFHRLCFSRRWARSSRCFPTRPDSWRKFARENWL